jgi:hypothetical protein
MKKSMVAMFDDLTKEAVEELTLLQRDRDRDRGLERERDKQRGDCGGG